MLAVHSCADKLILCASCTNIILHCEYPLSVDMGYTITSGRSHASFECHRITLNLGDEELIHVHSETRPAL